MEVVYEALGRNGPDCNNAITTAIEELEKMMAENNFEGLEGKSLILLLFTEISVKSSALIQEI